MPASRHAFCSSGMTPPVSAIPAISGDRWTGSARVHVVACTAPHRNKATLNLVPRAV
jgi:hypothetical protein